jgi:hypothetical protein
MLVCMQVAEQRRKFECFDPSQERLGSLADTIKKLHSHPAESSEFQEVKENALTALKALIKSRRGAAKELWTNHWQAHCRKYRREHNDNVR